MLEYFILFIFTVKRYFRDNVCIECSLRFFLDREEIVQMKPQFRIIVIYIQEGICTELMGVTVTMKTIQVIFH